MDDTRKAIDPAELQIDLAFGQNIKKYRSIRKMTQLELSELVPISRPSIANIEAGRQTITIRDLYKFSRALQVKATDLIPKIETGL